MLVAKTASEAHRYGGISTKLRLDLQGFYGLLLPGVALWSPRFVFVCDQSPLQVHMHALKRERATRPTDHTESIRSNSAVQAKLSLIMATDNIPAVQAAMSNVMPFPRHFQGQRPSHGGTIVSPSPSSSPPACMGLLIPCRDSQTSGVNRAVNEPSCS